MVLIHFPSPGTHMYAAVSCRVIFLLLYEVVILLWDYTHHDKKSYCSTDSQTGVCGIISIQSTFIKQLLCARAGHIQINQAEFLPAKAHNI